MAAAGKLMLCADDYALTPAVSMGILEALEAGRLDGTSAMTTRPFWPTAARDIESLGPVGQVGLHLDLTMGPSLTRMPRTAPAGQMPTIGRLIRLAEAGKLAEHEIRAEIGAQIDAFSEHYGRAPAYVDGHQHVQMLPQVRDWLFDALAKRGLAGDLWLRDSGDRLARILGRRIEVKKALLVAAVGRGFAAAAQARGFATNDGFAGYSAFDGRRDYAKDFARYLTSSGPRHLIMCHPGRVDSELERLDPVTFTREQELEFLLSDRFTDMMADHARR